MRLIENTGTHRQRELVDLLGFVGTVGDCCRLACRCD